MLKFGRPFSVETRESLLVAGEGIEYRYYDTESPYEEFMCVYQILKENVRLSENMAHRVKVFFEE